MAGARIPRSDRAGRRGLTINDVAQAAGVSIGTASKALNNAGHLRTETREKVLRVARELGYRPNDLAQSLHRARSMTVGLITNDSFGRFNMPIVEALEQRLTDQGIAIFMCNATDDPARERQHINQLLGKRIDGLVVTSRRADERPPVGPLPPGLPVIYVYRRRTAHIPGPERFEAVGLRHRGYVSELQAAGLEPAPGFYLSGTWSEGWGRDA